MGFNSVFKGLMYVTRMQISLRVSLWKRRTKFAHIPAQRFLEAFAKNHVNFRKKWGVRLVFGKRQNRKLFQEM